MGGHVFKDPKTKTPLTHPIKQEDIPTTVMWLELLLKIQRLSENLLGSSVYAETANDIDIAIDEQRHSKDKIYDRIVEYVKWRYPDQPTKSFVSKSGNCVHFRTPISGNDDFGYVQTDFMFGDPTWLKWSLRGESTAGFKGRHRHILLASITKYRNFRWSPLKGIMTREGVLLSSNIDAMPGYILGNDAKLSDLESISSIMRFIKLQPNWKQMISEAEETLNHEGISLMDTCNEA